jgi:hypothetical protein
LLSISGTLEPKASDLIRGRPHIRCDMAVTRYPARMVACSRGATRIT